jgi:hypothetical protein
VVDSVEEEVVVEEVPLVIVVAEVVVEEAVEEAAVAEAALEVIQSMQISEIRDVQSNYSLQSAGQ